MIAFPNFTLSDRSGTSHLCRKLLWTPLHERHQLQIK